jgi:AcrR family transcriptional regulator
LIAAGCVLAREGAHSFIVARVAEEAGVSVGSFYQYFPNKKAILFRLQSEEWKQTSGLLASILSDKSIARRRRCEMLSMMQRHFIEMRQRPSNSARLVRALQGPSSKKFFPMSQIRSKYSWLT